MNIGSPEPAGEGVGGKNSSIFDALVISLSAREGFELLGRLSAVGSYWLRRSGGSTPVKLLRNPEAR